MQSWADEAARQFSAPLERDESRCFPGFVILELDIPPRWATPPLDRRLRFDGSRDPRPREAGLGNRSFVLEGWAKLESIDIGSGDDFSGGLHSFDAVRSLCFALNVVVVVFTAWLAVRATGHFTRGPLEALVATLLATLILVVGVGTLLGEVGWFGPGGFLIGHCGMAAGMAFLRRKDLAADLRSLGACSQQLRAALVKPADGWGVALALLGALVALSGIAVGVEPAVLDAVTYRLPRLAHWLQEGRIGVIESEDARMTFVAGGWEIAVAWVLGATSGGYQLFGVVQVISGWLTVGATIGLARETGMSRTAALLSGALMLGMGNVVVQFAAAQTDLMTAGAFAASFYLWLRALRHGQVSILGIVGVGLALAVKGTVFYLVPGALVWVLWFGWRYPLSWRKWGWSIAVGAIGVAALAGPGFWRNFRAYGAALGPRNWVAKHHQGFDSMSGLLQKYRWNLGASLAQNFEPHSQPWPLRASARSLGVQLASTLPSQDPYTLDGRDRRGWLKDAVFNLPLADADVVAFGIVALLLFSLGTVTALVGRREPAAHVVLVWAGGTIVFFLFFHGMHQWHPFEFRYQVIAAPWVAIVSGWGIERLSRGLRLVAWVLIMAATAEVAAHVTFRTHQAGWRTIVAPSRSLGYFVLSNWQNWSAELKGPLRLALPEERPVAAFYRQGISRRVTYFPQAGPDIMLAEHFVPQDGCVVVPVTRFVGREGSVAASTWLFRGDEQSPFSVAAYRRLLPGETPAPVLYRNLEVKQGAETRRDLLVKTWSSDPVRFRIRNETEVAGTFVVTTPAGVQSGTVPSSGLSDVVVALPGNAVSEVTIAVRSASAALEVQFSVDLVR
jgi:4-amino-4-deoxy-L-arabinose transferase-like glycosyltransferase